MTVRILFYYRSTDPAIIEGKVKDHEGSLLIEQQVQAFAARFGAVPVFSMGIAPHFVGVTFPKDGPPPQHKKLWTEPVKNNICMRPKTQNIPSNLRGAAQKLAAEWVEHFPGELAKPRESLLLKALGLSEQALVGNAINYFYHGETSWIVCSMPLEGERFEEVTASVYDAARVQWGLEQAQLEQAQLAAAAQALKPAELVEGAASHG